MMPRIHRKFDANGINASHNKLYSKVAKGNLSPKNYGLLFCTGRTWS